MTKVRRTFLHRLEDSEYRRKFIHTLFLFYSFINVGLCFSQTGPSLLDLQLISNTDTEQAAVFFTGTSVGSMCGSLTMGVLFGRLNKAVLMSVTLLGAAIMTIALPWSSSYILMIIMHGLAAFFRAGFMAAGNTDIVRTWEGERRVFMQILHFSFALGGMLSPLITRPFLAPKVDATLRYSNSSDFEHHAETKVQFAYLTSGFLMFTASCLFFIQHFCHKQWHEDKHSRLTIDYKSLKKPLPNHIYIVTMAFILLIFFSIVAVETSIAAFILTFVVTHMNWSKPEGTSITSVFWACFAACRFAAIFFIEYLPPFFLLVLTSSTMLAASVGSLMSAINQSNTGIWTCVSVSGMALALQFPSTMTWIEESIIRLSPAIVSLIVLACTLPGVVNPLLIGHLMQHVSPLWLFYVLTIESSLCLLLYLSLHLWNRKVVQPTLRQLELETTEDCNEEEQSRTFD